MGLWSKSQQCKALSAFVRPWKPEISHDIYTNTGEKTLLVTLIDPGGEEVLGGEGVLGEDDLIVGEDLLEVEPERDRRGVGISHWNDVVISDKDSPDSTPVRHDNLLRVEATWS